jgi:hypothetical protein
MVSRLFFDAHTYTYIQRTDPLTRRSNLYAIVSLPTTFNCKSSSAYILNIPAYFIQIHIYIYMDHGMYKTIIDCLQLNNSCLLDDEV